MQIIYQWNKTDEVYRICVSAEAKSWNVQKDFMLLFICIPFYSIAGASFGSAAVAAAAAAAAPFLFALFSL